MSVREVTLYPEGRIQHVGEMVTERWDERERHTREVLLLED